MPASVTPAAIAAYLTAIPKENVHDVQPLTLTIRGTSYPAVRYRETCATAPGSDAYRRGERNYVREMMYCVGMLPRVYCRSSHIAFTMPDDTREWFIAGYFGAVTQRTQQIVLPNEFHPFGHMFLMAPWDIKDSRIDSYARVPYRRVPVAISV